MKTSEKLRLRRTKLGMTQAAVADAADMSVVQYNGYENDRHEPSESTMERLARALKADPDELWDDQYSQDLTIDQLKSELRKKMAELLGVKAADVRITVELD